MNEPLRLFPFRPELPGASRTGRGPAYAVGRPPLFRRLLVLLGSSAAAFSLTTWWLVYFQNSESVLNLVSEPSSVVRRQLSALNRGDLRAAYELFSEHYRHTVSFELFEHLVVTHRSIFRTREVRIQQSEQSPDRQVLETHIVAADGQHYVAQFTMKRGSGRWWIDDVHWGLESRRHLWYVKTRPPSFHAAKDEDPHS